eukprot:TRINITY_DN13009_c0_g1_i1.p1 TRINITY_DN13009_c0_g1~~TRINITY_DN13009_c0_g1_i1.p1  ORF type:complete len:721 (+),score=225.24 TRINITY_DN13009_c0_g1_i1:250-2163(+)
MQHLRGASTARSGASALGSERSRTLLPPGGGRLTDWLSSTRGGSGISRRSTQPRRNSSMGPGLQHLPSAIGVESVLDSVMDTQRELPGDGDTDIGPVMQTQVRDSRLPTALDAERGAAVVTVPDSLSVHWKEVATLPLPDPKSTVDEGRELLQKQLSKLAERHPNLAHIRDVIDCPDEGCTYVVYDRPVGSLGFDDVLALCQRALKREAAATRWIAHLCAGLAELHSRGIVHGRLDADAVFVDPNGNARVLYLAVDRVVLDGPHRRLKFLRRAKLQLACSKGHWCVGCAAPAHGMSRPMCAQLLAWLQDPAQLPPGFDEAMSEWEVADSSVTAAPELWGGGGPPDFVSDTWSLGVLWHVLLFGALPPCSDPAQPPGEELILPVGCSAEAAGLLRQLLATEPARRPTPAELLKQSLFAAALAEAARARAPNPLDAIPMADSIRQRRSADGGMEEVTPQEQALQADHQQAHHAVTVISGRFGAADAFTLDHERPERRVRSPTTPTRTSPTHGPPVPVFAKALEQERESESDETPLPTVRVGDRHLATPLSDRTPQRGSTNAPPSAQQASASVRRSHSPQSLDSPTRRPLAPRLSSPNRRRTGSPPGGRTSPPTSPTLLRSSGRRSATSQPGQGAIPTAF